MVLYATEDAAVERLYTLEETAKYLHVTVRTLRNWIKSGRLQALRIGKRLIIRESVLREFVDSLPQAAPDDVDESKE